MSEAGEPYGDVRLAKVAAGSLRQHDVYMLDGRRTLVLGVALGPPRLWSYLLELTLLGFVEGYEERHDGRVATRLRQGLRVAAQRLRARVDALIERRLPDVGLLALGLEGSQLHVASAGPLRAYRQRALTRHKLGPDSDSPSGLLRGASSWSADDVAPGDLLFAGSLTACSPPALSELDRALAHDRELVPRAVVQLLNRSPGEQGVAALSVAMRVPAQES